jgi:hypothetical protein
MPESAGLYVSKNKYLILLYISHYVFSRLAEKTASRKSLCFNRLEFLAYDPALSGIRPPEGRSYRWIARDLGISKNTVTDIVKRHRKNA